MNDVPNRHAVRLGQMLLGKVASLFPDAVTFELDLGYDGPGRAPFLGAGLRFDRTVTQEKARGLRSGDTVNVVLIDVDDVDAYDWAQASLPADPAWLTWNDQTVRRLARYIRDTREMHLLPVLADALEDAGCTDAALLEHCRTPKPDETRSWAVELLATQV